MSSLLLDAASGAIFGSVLTVSGIYRPTVISSQMGMTNFHMLKTFISATAFSALIIAVANRSRYAKLSHRTNSAYGWFGSYDANIVGGFLQGIGMAVTGACPGTVLVQMALGINSAWKIAVGCTLGGIAFVRFGPQLKRSSTSCGGRPSKHTVQDATGLSTSSTLLLWELLCLIVTLGANHVAPVRKFWLDPLLGGVLIGAAQATSVFLTRKSLGVSSAYQDIGKYLWGLFDGSARPGLSNIVFASGVAMGAKVISRYVPVVTEAGSPVSTSAALLGGSAIIFGARLAGGCTSGHGISGIATMSISSFVTVGSMFAGGITASSLLL